MFKQEDSPAHCHIQATAACFERLAPREARYDRIERFFSSSAKDIIYYSTDTVFRSLSPDSRAEVHELRVNVRPSGRG